MTNRTSLDHHRTLRLLGALAGLSVLLGGCMNSSGEVVTASVPDDYRLRHPIVVEEANHSIVVFVGQGRGGLTASERADVAGLARTWLSEGTGAITVDVPIDTPNARAAAYTSREIRSMCRLTRRTPGPRPIHPAKSGRCSQRAAYLQTESGLIDSTPRTQRPSRRSS